MLLYLRTRSEKNQMGAFDLIGRTKEKKIMYLGPSKGFFCRLGAFDLIGRTRKGK
jgi:hypothetical protein